MNMVVMGHNFVTSNYFRVLLTGRRTNLNTRSSDICRFFWLTIFSKENVLGELVSKVFESGGFSATLNFRVF